MGKRVKKKASKSLSHTFLYLIYVSFFGFIIAVMTSLFDDWKIVQMLDGGALSVVILLCLLAAFVFTLKHAYKLMRSLMANKVPEQNVYLGGLFSMMFLLFFVFYEYFSISQLLMAILIELRSPEAISLTTFLFSFEGILFIIYWALGSSLLLILSLHHLGYLKKKM